MGLAVQEKGTYTLLPVAGPSTGLNKIIPGISRRTTAVALILTSPLRLRTRLATTSAAGLMLKPRAHGTLPPGRISRLPARRTSSALTPTSLRGRVSAISRRPGRPKLTRSTRVRVGETTLILLKARVDVSGHPLFESYRSPYPFRISPPH